MKQDLIAIIDLGNTENSALARRIRAKGVYSEIYNHLTTAKELTDKGNVKGIILNGGERRNVNGKDIDIDVSLYYIGIPVTAVDHPAAKCENNAELSDALLDKFLFAECKCEKNWNMQNFIDDQVELLRNQIGNEKVLLALSGGVDSSVVAALLLKAIGNNLTCVHVNHGLLRKGEPEQVIEVFKKQFNANLIYVDAVDRFLDKLAGVADPEKKRKIIGSEFIDVFKEKADELEGIRFLGQGTIYPDIAESGTLTAKTVKSHHNVGGLPEILNLELVEPIKYLFKDEVRECGRALGFPEGMVNRQPFPGPGLGVRCVGAITRDRLEAVREADAILREEFANAGLQGKTWQYFTVIPDVKSTGVRDGERSWEWPCVIRAVNTVDAMTATVEHPDWALLDRISERITHEVKGVNRVLYDLTAKPVATIEWE